MKDESTFQTIKEYFSFTNERVVGERTDRSVFFERQVISGGGGTLVNNGLIRD